MFNINRAITLNEFTRFKDFTVWFKRKSPTMFEFACIEDPNRLHGTITDDHMIVNMQDDESCDYSKDDVKSEFMKYKSDRPEYWVGKKINTSELDPSELIWLYEQVLVGCALIRAKNNGCDIDDVIAKATKPIEYLRNTDFYSAPASTQYHDSNPSGLLIHTLNVINNAVELLKVDKFSSVDISSAVLCAAVHDWCKIGLYEPYKRNVKDETTGQWTQVTAYRYTSDRPICLGHGASSMYMAMKFFNLSLSEAAAIRYHMGRWNCVDSEVNELQQANRTYPLAHLIQFADQLATVNY